MQKANAGSFSMFQENFSAFSEFVFIIKLHWQTNHLVKARLFYLTLTQLDEN